MAGETRFSIGEFSKISGLTVNTLKSIISIEREAQKMAENSPDQIEEKSLESTLIAGVRMRGLYSEIGKGFSQIGRKLGRHIAGSDERVESLNAQLWTYKERGFLPHGSAKDGFAEDQPGWLTAR